MHVHQLKGKNPPILVSMMVNNELMPMEVDTRAAVSVLSEKSKLRKVSTYNFH